MTWILPVTTALPIWGDFQPAHDTGNIWCTFLHQWEPLAAASVGQDQEDFQEDLESYAVVWGTWTTLEPPGQAHVCL